MRPTVVGISYRTAPVEAREQVALADEALRLAHRRLAEQTGQAVILSTCNRTEFYTLTDAPDEAREAVAQLLRDDAGVDYEALASYFYAHHDEDAARPPVPGRLQPRLHDQSVSRRCCGRCGRPSLRRRRRARCGRR